jgi:hypothetical protein
MATDHPTILATPTNDTHLKANFASIAHECWMTLCSPNPWNISTSMTIYGDAITDEISRAAAKVLEIAFPAKGAQTERGTI